MNVELKIEAVCRYLREGFLVASINTEYSVISYRCMWVLVQWVCGSQRVTEHQDDILFE